MLYPFLFEPRLKERVWGGQNLARLYGKNLPPGKRIGESWEITDRPGDASVITNGPLAGRDLRWLMEHQQTELLGDACPLNGRFPLLIKILDAQEKLSLQVHPPAAKATALGGEPKTEMWYVAEAVPNAELYVGLKRGSSRADFEQKLFAGSVAECFHRISVVAGTAMFLPSGRVHAIGAGLVLFEIQQNSDTTYRVFDWNRVGMDGKARELHVEQALACIDFDDIEPALVSSKFEDSNGLLTRVLVRDSLFSVQECKASAGASVALNRGQMQIIACLQGRIKVCFNRDPSVLSAGEFCLVPAACKGVSLQMETDGGFLQTTAG